MVLYRRLKSQLREALWKSGLFLPAFLLWLLYRVVAATIRGRVINDHLLPGRFPSGQNAIYVFWHSKTFMVPPYAGSRRMAAFTLLNWQNRIFDQICRLYRIRTIPVRSAAASALALEHLLRQGYHVGLALDGPRGPVGMIRPGALYLARKTGCPIICVNIRIDRSIRLRRRWDKLEIPLPFSRGIGTLSLPIAVNKHNVEEARRKILEALPDL